MVSVLSLFVCFAALGCFFHVLEIKLPLIVFSLWKCIVLSFIQIYYYYYYGPEFGYFANADKHG